jgi:hypothetical protein
MLRTYDLSNQQAIAMVYATVPTTPDAVGRCVQFAMNERLPPMLKAMMADGAFKTLGFEPTEAALAAMSVSFAIALDGLFNEYVRFLLLAQQGKIVTEPPRGYAKLNTEVPKSSGCVILLGILLAVLTFLATFH